MLLVDKFTVSTMTLRISIAAFCINNETVKVVEALQNQRQYSRCQIINLNGSIGVARNFLAENETPNLLIIETDLFGDLLFEELELLASVFDPNSRLMLIGQENDIKLYRQLLEMGISEYICSPITEEQLKNSINELYADPEAIDLGRVIACVGARGGAGSSTVAANLAYTLGQQYLNEVILVDLDLCFGTAALALNLQQRQNISDAFAQPNRLDDVLIERFMLKYNEYLSVVAAPTVLGSDYEVPLDAFEIFLELVRKMSPFIVLDVPHQWSPWVSEILLDANEVLVTAYPDLANLRDAQAILQRLMEKRNVDEPTRLVLNRVGMAKGSEIGPKDFEGATKVGPALNIPFDPKLFGIALNNGQSIAEVSKRAKSTKLFSELATIVSGKMKDKQERSRRGHFDFMKSKK